MCRKFRKEGLFAAILPVVCLFTSCDEPSYTITEITNFRPVANGLQIKVSPTNVKLDKYVSIDAIHDDKDTVDVIISSKSLAFTDSIITSFTNPYHTRMKMDRVGIHDLSFTVKDTSIESTEVVTIVVKK